MQLMPGRMGKGIRDLMSGGKVKKPGIASMFGKAMTKPSGLKAKAKGITRSKGVTPSTISRSKAVPPNITRSKAKKAK